jgi:hypothetical protein
MMEHPDNPVAMGDRTMIAHLQRSVQAWIDSDRVLPADGSALLAALDRVQEELADGDSEERAPGAAAQARIAAFVDQVQALIAAGLLEIDNDPPLIEARGAGCLAPERPRKR